MCHPAAVPALPDRAVLPQCSRTAAASPIARPGTTATVSGSATPGTEPTAAPTKAASDGRISQTDLGNAALDLPKWADPDLNQQLCPSGQRQFSKGRTKASDEVAELSRIGVTSIKKVVYADVDNDGAARGDPRHPRRRRLGRGGARRSGDLLHRRRAAGDGLPLAYSWAGAAFAQTGGPTAMPQNPRLTDLGVKLADTPCASTAPRSPGR